MNSAENIALKNKEQKENTMHPKEILQEFYQYQGIIVRNQELTLEVRVLEAIMVSDTSPKGGGLYAVIQNEATAEIIKATFIYCSSSYYGGGIYSHIESGGQVILDKSCEFYQSNNGLGGRIYVWINLTAKCSFAIKDAFIHECAVLNSTNSSLSYSRSGFGGGIFLGYNGDYDPSTKLIDLRGMKIYNNSADKYGKSLFVAMIKIEEFCKQRTQGEYAKGNYSDTYSNETDLYGIPMDLFTFFYATPEMIQQQSQPLKPWWRILGILKRALVTANISNPIGKLIFHLEGQRMVPGYLNNLHNYENEIIYPPEVGSSSTISIEGEIQCEQKTSFEMNDGSWFNYKEKLYAVLISNDGDIFTGKDGIDFDEDSNAAILLEVIIEEEEKAQGLSIGIIVGIAAGALAIIAVIIIIIIVVQRNQQVFRGQKCERVICQWKTSSHRIVTLLMQ
ncbi:MAG: hypothetical protein EZS28_031760 [Streblomastix strix]|uniref:Uncharacterized protein n=1 Tax=Streblomastix strix TaxID=222440 RepID=A0A5J4URN9_9EUKA|nr:MAG: hypothetical protein EZS28_031760 [Streblomastix strix]